MLKMGPPEKTERELLVAKAKYLNKKIVAVEVSLLDFREVVRDLNLDSYNPTWIYLQYFVGLDQFAATVITSKGEATLMRHEGCDLCISLLSESLDDELIEVLREEIEQEEKEEVEEMISARMVKQGLAND